MAVRSLKCTFPFRYSCYGEIPAFEYLSGLGIARFMSGRQATGQSTPGIGRPRHILLRRDQLLGRQSTRCADMVRASSLASANLRPTKNCVSNAGVYWCARQLGIRLLCSLNSLCLKAQIAVTVREHLRLHGLNFSDNGRR